MKENRELPPTFFDVGGSTYLSVNTVFEEAGIPLVRIKPGMVVNSKELTVALSAVATILPKQDAA